jgi:hypothetical protein
MKMRVDNAFLNDERFEDDRLFRRIWHLAVGFLGWFVAMGLYGLAYDQYVTDIFRNTTTLLLSFFLLPLNLTSLVIFLFPRRLRWIGLGIFAAMIVNYILSFYLGLLNNMLLLVPFFVEV